MQVMVVDEYGMAIEQSPWPIYDAKHIGQDLGPMPDQLPDRAAVAERPGLMPEPARAVDRMKQAGVAQIHVGAPGLQQIVGADQVLVERAPAMAGPVGVQLLLQERCQVFSDHRARPS
jgi:hypothetical protein